MFAVEPMHPAHHYRIHLWDDEKPARAVESAALCGQTSPGIAHMWHMPGHIYSELHRYADAAWQQEASARVDHAHMMRDRVLPDQIHNYAHNNEWLIRNLGIVGRVHDAIDLAKNMIELPRHPKYNTIEQGSASFGRERLVEHACSNTSTGMILSRLPPDRICRRLTSPMRRSSGPGCSAERTPNCGHSTEARDISWPRSNQMLTDERAARYKSADEAETKARADQEGEDDDCPPHGRRAEVAFRADSTLERAIGRSERPAANWLPAIKSAAKAEFDKLKDDDELRRDQFAQLYLRLGEKAEAERLARSAAEGSTDEVYRWRRWWRCLTPSAKKTRRKDSSTSSASWPATPISISRCSSG